MLIAGLALTAAAQKPDTLKRTKATVTDSLNRRADSLQSKPFKPGIISKKNKVFIPDTLHSPHKAVIRSLIIPGWGQAYNHHYWKIPLIYGALGSLGYYIWFNERDYKGFLAVAKYQRDPFASLTEVQDPKYNGYPYIDYIRKYGNAQTYPNAAVINQKDYSLRNRDLCILGFLLSWGVNCIDAYVFAKFKHSYSMDNNLSDIHISGGLMNNPLSPVYAANFNTFTPAIKLTITLR